jgi:hypothetical protein
MSGERTPFWWMLARSVGSIFNSDGRGAIGHDLASAAFFARLQNAGRLRRYTHRAEGRNIGRGSNRRRMKVQLQVGAPAWPIGAARCNARLPH